MSERAGHEHEAGSERDNKNKGTASIVAVAEGLADFTPVVSGVIAGDSRLNGRGNGPARIATMQRMQQQYGNRATQRVLQRQAARKATSPAPTDSHRYNPLTWFQNKSSNLGAFLVKNKDTVWSQLYGRLPKVI